MADTTYPNLSPGTPSGFIGPEVGSSADTWGNKLNADLLIIDNLFAPTGTGTVIRRNAAGRAAGFTGVEISDTGGGDRAVRMYTGTSLRWVMGTLGGSESGTAGGSDFVIARSDNTGAPIDFPVSITRSTGIVQYQFVPLAAGSPVLTQATAGALASVIGAIQMFAGSGDPANWMICDGRSLLVASFPALNAVIGTTYGGSGGNFNIPNLRGKVVAGVDGSTFPSLGAAVGELAHTLLASEMPSHQHNVPDPGHTHAFTWQKVADEGGSGGAARVTDINATADSQTATTQANAARNLPSDPIGGGAPHNIIQPTMAMNFIIRVQ